ncbi:MAG: branched-chain amino acid ABC transporter permease [Nitrososphaerales archaeon]
MSVGVTDLVQFLISGLLQGGFFALASVGLTLIFGVQRILNVAQGAFIVLASFLTFQFSIILTPMWHLDPLFSILLDFVVLGAVGGVSYLVLIYRIENTGFEAPLLATFGLSIFLEYVVTNGLSFAIPLGSRVFHLALLPQLNPTGAEGVQVENTALPNASFNVGPFVIQEAILIAFILAIVLIPLLHVFLTKTYFGRAIRATSQDQEAAEFSGINVRLMRFISFSLGSSLAGVAGGIYVFTSPVTATAGDEYLLPFMLAVIIIGGVGSMLGTLLGGFIIGLILSVSDFVVFEVIAGVSVPKDLGSVIAFLFFLVVLMVRPNGLFGNVANKRGIFRNPTKTGAKIETK